MGPSVCVCVWGGGGMAILNYPDANVRFRKNSLGFVRVWDYCNGGKKKTFTEKPGVQNKKRKLEMDILQ